MTNTNEKKTISVTTSTPSSTTTKHKQRKTSLKLLPQQNANDSGDDNLQQKGKPRHHHHHHHKKVRMPRTLSPLKPKQSFTLPTHTTGINIPTNSKSQDLVQSTVSPTSPQITPSVSISNETEFKKSASSHALIPPSTMKTNAAVIPTNPNKQMKYSSQQQRNFPRSLSKSFSSSSSSSSPPPPFWFNYPVRLLAND
jgi:hypothetical protein